MSLQVVASADVGGDPRLDAPLSPGLLVVTAGAKYLGKADSTASLKFTQNLDNWESIPCDTPNADRKNLPQLRGDLKIYDWLKNIRNTIKETDSEIPEAGYTVEFTIDKTAGLGPTFSLVPVGNNLFGASFKLNGGRKDVHKIIIAFARNEPPSSGGKKGKKAREAADNKAILDQLNVLTIIDAVKDK
ncbi:hypothetical protein [Mesorhizobium sp. 10J20-29]